MISVLALVVAALAVFFGPLVTRANTQRQIRAAAREAWMHEFRQHAAEILRNHRLRPDDETGFYAIWLARRLSYHAMRLLIAERAPQYDAFVPHLEAMWNKDTEAELKFPEEFTTATADILQRERTTIAGDPGVWREVWIGLGVGAVRWRPWSWLRAWLARDRPHFPD